MDHERVASILRHQDGVVGRRRVLECGGSDDDIARLLRRRQWARILSGVYVDHTGPPTWRQRAWAGVLYHRPAALAGASALRAAGLDRATEPRGIELAVQWPRRVVDPSGYCTTTIADFDGLALRNLSPPRVRLERAALQVAARSASEDAAVAVLGDVCQQRFSTPGRLLEALGEQTRLRHRALLTEVLGDVAVGTNSALERRYLRHVERAHGLPEGDRQVRAHTPLGVVYRDVKYVGQFLVVELDGRLGHDGTADAWDDLERDVEAALGGLLTVRAGWRQALQPCRLSASVAAILSARGWSGAARPCRGDCPARTTVA